MEFRLDHVCVALSEIDKSIVGLIEKEVLCGNPYDAWAVAPEENTYFEARQWMFENGSIMEVIKPVPEEMPEEHKKKDFLLHFLARERQSNLHHVTFKVSDFKKAIKYLQDKGWKMIAESHNGPDQVLDRSSWSEAFISPKDSEAGIVIQIAQMRHQCLPPNHDEEATQVFKSSGSRRTDTNEYERQNKRHSQNNNKTKTDKTGLVALHMYVKKSLKSKMVRLWGDSLGGKLLEDKEGETVFRWVNGGNPMNIHLHYTSEDDQSVTENWLEFYYDRNHPHAQVQELQKVIQQKLRIKFEMKASKGIEKSSL